MRTYKCLITNRFSIGDYSILPIRDCDKYEILKWRNEQIYHLRQTEVITKKDQDYYFKSVVDKLFEVEKPNQLLFSYFQNDIFIGYGGLVHINWKDSNGEISFLLGTEYTNNIEKHCVFFENFLKLIQNVGFIDLKFNRLYAEVYDLRPYHNNVLVDCGFKLEGKQREHILFENKFIDSLIYGKLNREYGY